MATYKKLISQINLKELLDKIIELHFDNHNFTLKGKLKWYPVTEQQKTRYLKKRGKELKFQRRRYKTIEVFWEKPKEEKKASSPYFFYHHILISEIEENDIFYCIDDNCLGRMGQKIRYKFQIKDFQKSMKLTDLNIKLLNNTMIMIR